MTEPAETHARPAAVATRLMRHAQTGCQSSFRQLHDMTRNTLRATVSRVNRDREQAEEILQDTYLKAWLMRGQYDHQRGHAIDWLRGIARNEAISAVRTNARRPRCLFNGEQDPFDELPSEAESPEQAACAAQLKQAFDKRLMRLGVDERASITLVFFNDLSHAEVAQRVRRPLGTVKSWIRRSLLSMQAPFEPHR